MDDIDLEEPTYIDDQDQEVDEDEVQASERGQIDLYDLEEDIMLQIITMPVIRAQKRAVPETKHSSPVFAGVILLYKHRRCDYFTRSEHRIYQINNSRERVLIFSRFLEFGGLVEEVLRLTLGWHRPRSDSYVMILFALASSYFTIQDRPAVWC